MTVQNLKILLIGQPNVGKSSLLNALVGPKVMASNYPGTTVEIFRFEKIFNGTKIEFEDTPGIYSISDRSEEEKVTERALFEKESDGVVIVADASSLERSLYMVLQVLEAQKPVILALNFIEEAKKKGIEIDYKKLEKFLSIPVVPINPLTKKGINEILVEILKIKKLSKEIFNIEYDDHLEKAIDKIVLQLKKVSLSKRFISLRILEEDQDFYKYLKNHEIIEEVKKDLKRYHSKLAEDVSITRYGMASFIARKVTQITSIKEGRGLEEKIDNILLDKIWGPIITGLFLITIFGILLSIGGLFQEFLMGLTEVFLSLFIEIEHSLLSAILIQGLTGLAAGISIALPYVFLFYLLLGLLEDIGILSRFIVNSQRFLNLLGLPGKSFIPLMLGLGCTAPATHATRVLSSKKEQFYTASFFSFVPCSSRIAIIMGVVGFYGGIKLAIAVFATLIIAGFIWALGIKKVIHIKNEPLLLELPPYRKPLIKNIFSKSWIRMRDFVYIVIPLLMIGGVFYGILNSIGFTNVIVEPFSAITKWLGLPSMAIIPLVFGFLQKDLTGAMLLSVFGSDISLILTPLQIYTFGVAATIGIPCIIALGMLSREFGFKKSTLLTVISIAYGFLFAGIAWRLIYILGKLF